MCNLYTVRLSRDEVKHLLQHRELIGKNYRDIVNVYPNGEAPVMVLDADGRQARRRPLQLGRRADGVIEVLGGLQAGEQVVVSPYRAFAAAQNLQLY